MRRVLASTTVLALLTGCASNSPRPPAASPVEAQSAQGGSSLSGGDMNYEAENEEQVLIPRISLIRKGGFSNSQLSLKITPSGRYLLWNHVGDNSTSSEGQLTKDQRRAIVSAFKGWEELKPEYLPKNGMPDDYTIELTFNGKTVTGSDAAELPPAFVRAYGTLRNRIGSFPSN